MAVTAYASGNATPISNPNVDPEIDLSAVALPQTVQLYGDAFDSDAPANTSWTWTWTILDDDSPSNSATLSSAVAENPTVDVPTWRNVRLFLVVQNTISSAISEQNPLLAPDSAFVTIRVLSDTAGLQKIAAGERNYTTHLHDVIAQVELDAEGVGTHTIASHSDTTATGAELETLTDGSNATGLHTHSGPDVAAASSSARGTVTLEETGVGAAKVITRERIQLSAFIDGTRVTSSGWVGGQIVPASYESDQSVASGVPLAIWRADEEIKILNWAVTLADGGSASPTNPYEFRLGVANATNAAANSWSAIGTTITGAPTADNRPLVLTDTLASEYTLGAANYIAVFCLAAPRLIADGELPGGGMTCQIFARREVD